MIPALVPFQPYQALPAGELAHAQGVELYLDSLQLRIQAGSYSEQAYGDASRDLRRFAVWVMLPAGVPYKGARATDAFHQGGQGRQSIAQGRNDDLTRWLLINQQWKSPNSKARVYRTILACFKWLEDERYIDRTPYRRQRGLTFPTKSRREARPDEYITLMRKGSRPLRRGLYFLQNAGARTCEMREAQYNDVLWGDSVIRLYRHKTARITGQPRIVGLTPRVLRFLKNLFRQRPPWPDNIFLNSDNTPWDRHTFARNLRRCAKRIGLDEGAAERVSGYCFRHTAATEGEEGGMTEQDMATFLGHEDTRMLRNYSKARKKIQHVRNVAGRVEAARKKHRRREKGKEDNLLF